MSLQKTYVAGNLYRLDEIRGLAPQLKMVSKQSLKNGLFILYREISNANFWAGGPFVGKDSNLFLFMGQREAKSQFFKTMRHELLTTLQEAYKKMEERTREYGGLGDVVDFTIDFDVDLDFSDIDIGDFDFD